MVNGTIIGVTNLSNINVGTAANGVATLSVQIINGGCTSVATKTVIIDTLPNIVFQNASVVCKGDSLVLNASPSGGSYSGVGVTGNLFHSASVGTSTVSYSYTNPNGCSNTASKTLTINLCSGIKEVDENGIFVKISPNPNEGEFSIALNTDLQRGWIEIYNSLSQLVIAEPIERATKINMKEEGSGIYFMRIFEKDKIIYTTKVVKE